MRFVSFFSRFILFVAALVSVNISITLAQQIEMPDGEAIVAVNTLSSTDVCRLACTRSTVYSSKFTGGSWSKGKLVYQTNPARRIVDAVFKTGEVGDTRNYAILLDNGEVVIFEYNSSSESFTSKVMLASPAIPQGGNTAYRKILFADNISVQFGTSFFRNLNDGSTPWKRDTVGLGRLTIADISLDIYDGLYAATNKGVLKFDPTVGSWSRVGANADTLSIAAIFGSRNGRIYAGTANRSTWFSTDKGATWTRDSAGIGVVAISRFGDDAGNTIYAATGGNNGQLYRKTSSGTSWERIDANLKTTSNVLQIRINDLSGESAVEVGTAFGCYTGASNGDSWTYSTSGIMAEDIYGVQFLGTSTVVSTGLGIYHKQGTSWTKVYPTAGFSGTRPLIRSDKAGVSYFQLAATGGGGTGAAAQGAIFASTDDGNTWATDSIGLSTVPASTSNFLGSVFYADRNATKHIVNSSGTGVPMRLYSSKSTWGIDTIGMGLIASTSQTQGALTMHTDFSMSNDYVGGVIYNQTFAIDGSILFTRSHSGGNWTVDTMGLNKSPVTSITSSKVNTYCGTSAVNGISSIFRKNGAQWDKIASPPSAVSDVRALTVDSTGVLYVAYSPLLSQNVPNRGVYATSDNGATWLYAGLDSVTVRGIVATNNTVYAFTSRGTYKLTLQGLKAAEIQFDKHELNFDKVPLNVAKDTTVRISNTGNDTLRVTSFRSLNQQITAFSVVPSQFTIAPGQSLDVIVRFIPNVAGVISTTLRSVSNTLPDTILVTGEGLKPNAEIQFSNKSILFDAITIGKSKDSIIQISNPGTDTLKVTNVISTNPVFSCIPKVFVVAPSGKTSVMINFAPTVEAAQNGQIRFITNIGNDSIAVFGSGNPSSVKEKEYADKLKMTINPNPISSNASLHFTLQSFSDVNIYLVNSLGENTSAVYSGSLEAGEHIFPLQFTSGGVYFVRLVTRDGTGTLQVAVVK